METVIRYRSEEAKEAGLAQAVVLQSYLKDVEYNIQSIIRPLRKGFSVERIAIFLDTNESIIKEFNQLVSPLIEKKIFKATKKLRTKFSVEYTVEQLKADTVFFLLSIKLSDGTINHLTKCPLSLIKEIKKISAKK